MKQLNLNQESSYLETHGKRQCFPGLRGTDVILALANSILLNCPWWEKMLFVEMGN